MTRRSGSTHRPRSVALRSGTNHARNLHFEPLEDRRVLSITVNTLTDVNNASDGLTTLREAVAAAASGDTIDFSVTGTINLSNLGQIAINKALTISGPGADQLTIRAYDPTPSTKTGDGSHVFAVDVPSVIATISLSGLKFTGGDAKGSNYGGAIFSKDSLTINGCVISDNSSQFKGGGIYISGVGTTLNLTSSTVSGNTSNYGAGIYANDTTVNLTSSTLDGNTSSDEVNSEGGGVYARGNLHVVGCTISNNHSSHGGGIGSGSPTVIEHSMIFGNTGYSGAGIYTSGLTVHSSTISGNIATGGSGGGLYSSGTIHIDGCSVHDNTCTLFGGGICAPNGGEITNTTIVHNNASLSGGGVSIFHVTMSGDTFDNNSGGDGGALSGSGFTVSYCTFTNNHGGGGGAINSGGGQSCTVTNCLLSHNSAGYGGAVWASNDFTIASSVIRENNAAFGGGAYLTDGATAVSCLFEGNDAGYDGGGIYIEDASASQCTFAGNRAGQQGLLTQHLDVYPASLSYCTIVDNTAGYSDDAEWDLKRGGGITTNSLVTNSIIAHNFVNADPNDWWSPDLTKATYNLIQTFAGDSSTGGTGNILGQDPLLSQLAYHGGALTPGGAVLSYDLLPGSPALNMGDPAAVAGTSGVPQYDQRGNPFARVVGGRVDMGAIETQPNPLPGDYNFNGVVDAGDYIVWRHTSGSTTDLRADVDGNGAVDQADYNFWRSHFGQFSAAAGGSGQALDIAFAEASAPPELLLSTAQAETRSAANSESTSRTVGLIESPVTNAPFSIAKSSELPQHANSETVDDQALLAWLESRGDHKHSTASSQDAYLSPPTPSATDAPRDLSDSLRLRAFA